MDQLFLDKLVYEREATDAGFSYVAGVDEAGRGPLAGPVVAGACLLPKGKVFLGIDDSKKLSSNKRRALYQELISDPEVVYGIGVVSADRIDTINIFEATKEAMNLAIEALSVTPDFLLVDGMHLPHTIPCRKLIKGDSLSASIAAASILAKEYRDDLMRALHELFPCYGFDQHKGYGTAKHLVALKNFGPCEHHRKSFAPVKKFFR